MDPSRSLPGLPLELQARILTGVSRGARGLEHALVCRLWRDLATAPSPNAAGLTVQVRRNAPPQLLSQELRELGACVERLDLQHRSYSALEPAALATEAPLKLPSLRCLHVYRGDPRTSKWVEHPPPESGGGGQATGADLNILGACFPRLRTLRISLVDQVLVVPPGISQLANLTSLIISCASLDALPLEVGSLTALRRCVLESSQQPLENFPESLYSLPSLAHLEIRAHSMPPLPEKLGCLTRLRVLRLPKLTVDGASGDWFAPSGPLPQSIAKLTALKELHLPCCRLEGGGTLSMEGMAHLTKLNIKCSARSPTCLEGATALRALGLCLLGGRMESLCSLSRLKSLRNLTVHGAASLTALSEQAFSLPRLTHLEVAGLIEGLKALFPGSASLPQLTTLKISGCHNLPSLSQENWHMPNLRSLVLSGKSADTLPLSLGTCTGLEEVKVGLASLCYLPHGLLRCPTLRSLNLHANIESLPPGVPLALDGLPHLESLHTKCQILAHLVPGNTSVPCKLRELSIECNHRRCRPDTSELPAWLTQLTCLTHLGIRHCRCLVHLPIELLGMPSLRASTRNELLCTKETLWASKRLRLALNQPSEDS